MPTLRKTGLSVSAFSSDSTSYLDDLENCTVSIEISEEDARACKDGWAYAWSYARRWTIEADVFVAAAAAFMSQSAGDGLVAISYNSGANTYAGTGVLNVDHVMVRDGLQKQRVRISGQGEITVTPPS
ncbi:MAG: hypothetical protein KIT45_06655 [Fimbriimonadia bacterium]|nr:hypothetical protein [Fimbriimonadia bacterium]